MFSPKLESLAHTQVLSGGSRIEFKDKLAGSQERAELPGGGEVDLRTNCSQPPKVLGCRRRWRGSPPLQSRNGVKNRSQRPETASHPCHPAPVQAFLSATQDGELSIRCSAWFGHKSVLLDPFWRPTVDLDVVNGASPLVQSALCELTAAPCVCHQMVVVADISVDVLANL